FFINKVFDDPSSIARNGTSAFRTQFLAAIPFDLDATRSFLIGDIPDVGTIFGRQIRNGASKALPPGFIQSIGTPLRFEDFRGLGIRDRDSSLGGLLLGFSSIGLGLVLLVFQISRIGYLSPNMYIGLLMALVLTAALGSTEPTRRLFGRIALAYLDVASKIVSRLAK